MSPTRLPDARLLDPRLERRLAGVEKLLGLGRDLAHAERPGRVGDEPAERHADVDGDHVALEPSVYSPGMPCTTIAFGETQIDAGIAAVPLEGRDAAAGADVLLGERVELGRRHARLHVLGEERDDVRDDLAGLGHLVDLCRLTSG